MKALILLLVASLSCAVPASAVGYKSSHDVAASLEQLDAALNSRDAYISERQGRIDRLRDSLKAHPSDLPTLLGIADEYISFENDSALVYLDRGIRASRTADESMPFRLRRVTLMPLAGFFEAAAAAYDSIDAAQVPNALLPLYYDSGRQMYSYLGSFFKGYSGLSRAYNERALGLQKRLLEVLPHESTAYRFNLGEYYFLTGDYTKAEPLLSEVIEHEPPKSNLRARATHHLSTIARERGDEDAYLYYLAQSAISDAVSATREVVSLQELGQQMYERDDINHAYDYLSMALTNAVECGAPLRMVESSRSLPIIEQANSDNIRSWRRTIYIVIVLLALFLAALVVALFLLHREIVRQRNLQRTLRDANHVKEVYISQFLSLCSIYMDKLNQFCKIAERKIAAGKVDDLYRLTKSGKFVEEQSAEFYEVFDDAFLHIYPDFVESVNALLRPDARIELREGERLNTDLRILAFMRLGIEESARIAQVLNYSLNTIYAYRNRLKARAINRDTFDRDVMAISSVEA